MATRAPFALRTGGRGSFLGLTNAIAASAAVVVAFVVVRVVMVIGFSRGRALQLLIVAAACLLALLLGSIGVIIAGFERILLLGFVVVRCVVVRIDSSRRRFKHGTPVITTATAAAASTRAVIDSACNERESVHWPRPDIRKTCKRPYHPQTSAWARTC